MTKAVNSSMFTPAVVGKNRISVSHLQFADDTIFVGKATMENVVFLNRFLSNLEFVSGLRVNLNKNSLYGVNVGDGKLYDLAGVMGCEVGRIPFVYLGLKYPLKREKEDKWRWEPEPKGTYTTRSVYNWLTTKSDGHGEEEEGESNIKVVWTKFSHLKVSFHAWRVLKERIPTTTNL
ncbi:hypothetical protein ACS0TY_030339 [Phlomoides rotata]